MSVGNDLLPATEAALRDDLGEFCRPRDSHQLAAWMRSVGCPDEAARVAGNERLCRDLVACFRDRFR